jgi:microcystin degradation protein MlrC
MSLIDTALDFARAFLRTPLEQAELSAIPAGERLLEAIEAHFATPQGILDKQLFETLGSRIMAGMDSALTVDAAPIPEPPAQTADYPGAHGRLMPPGM